MSWTIESPVWARLRKAGVPWEVELLELLELLEMEELLEVEVDTISKEDYEGLWESEVEKRILPWYQRKVYGTPVMLPRIPQIRNEAKPPLAKPSTLSMYLQILPEPPLPTSILHSP